MKIPDLKVFTGTCPECGKVEMGRKFTFCPDCGKPIKESDWNSKPIKMAKRPTEINSILEEMGCTSESEKQKMLGSIRYSKDRSNVISGHYGDVA